MKTSGRITTVKYYIVSRLPVDLSLNSCKNNFPMYEKEIVQFL